MDPLQDISLQLILPTFAASIGIKKGNRFLRGMFLGTAATTGVILFYPWVRQMLL